MCWRDSFTQTQSRKTTEPRRRGAASTTPRGLERGRNGRVQSTLRDCRPIDGLLTRMQPSERSPKWRPVLRRAYNAPLQSAVHLSSTLSIKTAKSCHMSVCPMQFGWVDKASSILFAVFWDCTLGGALFAFAVFIAISDKACCLPLNGCSDLIRCTMAQQCTDLRFKPKALALADRMTACRLSLFKAVLFILGRRDENKACGSIDQ